ncbi:MAG: TetR/AcrR family transcriptional regulator [Acidimicrobiales bacterium]
MPVHATSPEPLAALLSRLPARPAASADRALDALATCLARYGMERTSMTDVAREMGASRSTLYRQFGSLELGAWALLVREAYRFFDAFGDIVAKDAGPGAVVELTGQFIRFASSHPVLVRMLRDEPAFLGDVMRRSASAAVDAAAAIVTPLLADAIERGMVRRHDPGRLARWLGRIVAVLVVAPPPDDLDDFLAEMLLPVLEP